MFLDAGFKQACASPSLRIAYLMDQPHLPQLTGLYFAKGASMEYSVVAGQQPITTVNCFTGVPPVVVLHNVINTTSLEQSILLCWDLTIV